MTYWTSQRRCALAVHAVIALLLLIWSMSSSYHFWRFAFRDEFYAIGAVAIIDMLALIGLAMHIARLQSPLVLTRHALPFVSALPLTYDMHAQFAHHDDPMLIWALTLSIVAILVALSFVVWRTIERICVPEIEAVRDYAHAQAETMRSRVEHARILRDATHEAALALLDAQPTIACMPHDAPHALLDTQPTIACMPHAAPHCAYACAQCGAACALPDGKTVAAMRAASGRWGCPQCRAK